MAVFDGVVPAIVGAAGAGAAAYEIERSLRFNSADSAYLNRTPSSAGNRRTWTWSGWVKRTKGAGTYMLMDALSGSYRTSLFFGAGDEIVFYLQGSTVGQLNAAADYRDFSAWYHLVFVCDTTDATATDRMKLFVNGERVTNFAVQTNPSLNQEHSFNDTVLHTIGQRNGQGYYNDGYLADVHFIDGQALAATDFGEYDSNNVWQPKEYSGTYGTNGFHLDFSDNSSNAALGTDSSGNNNDWTVNNLIASDPSVNLDAVDFTSSSTRLNVPSSSDFNLGSNWTLEFFFENRSTTSTRFYYFSNNSQNLQTTNNGTQLLFYNGSTAFTFGSISLNQRYHVALVNNGGTVTAYLDGVSITTFAAGTSATRSLTIGAFSDGQNAFDGKISNFRIVNGTSVYTSNFTPPTSNLSNITNTVLLCCQSSSSVTAATVTPGTITATGTPTVSSFVSNGSNTDSLIDTPTNYTAASGNNGGNYATWNPLDNAGTLANGNLDFSQASAVFRNVRSTFAFSSGKWYWESTVGAIGGAAYIGIGTSAASLTVNIGGSNTFGYVNNGNKQSNNTAEVSYGASYTTGDVIGVAFDADAGTLTFYKNGSSQGQAYSGLTSGPYFFMVTGYNGTTWNANFGQRPFAYTPPTGYKSLCTTNLADPTIADGSTAFDAKLYTGNGSTQTISGLGFSPDLVWTKMRSTTGYSHKLVDQVRGATKSLVSNNTNAELTETSGLTAFTSDGFSLGSQEAYNRNNDTFVGWAWDAGTSTVSNTDGSLTASVRANPSVGFSIATFTDLIDTAGSRTWGHGLNAAPQFIIMKARGASSNWVVYHAGYGTGYAFLNSTNTFTSSGQWNGVTSTTAGHNGGLSAGAYPTICYHWTPVEGYSAFGSYTGNGSTDGPFVYTGFRPRWLMIKNTSASGTSWVLHDTERDPDNIVNHTLLAESNSAESTPDRLDILSNGFKIKTTATSYNGNNNTFVFAAFSEHPFKTARAR